MIDLVSAFVGLPVDALKAIGTVAVGGVLAGGTYVLARIKEARRPAEQSLALPRIAPRNPARRAHLRYLVPLSVPARGTQKRRSPPRPFGWSGLPFMCCIEDLSAWRIYPRTL